VTEKEINRIESSPGKQRFYAFSTIEPTAKIAPPELSISNFR
jgi:hypothetical protein